MNKLNEITTQIKTLIDARDILQEKYEKSDFHKKKEKNPHSAVPPSPEDEEIIKLLNAIHQLDKYIKDLQNKQLEILKQHD